MKIKDIIQEAAQPWIRRSGFLQGALSGLTGLDFRDEDKVAKAIESIPEAEFQTKFGMTRQQFLDLPEDQQARVLASIRTIPPAPTPAPTPSPAPAPTPAPSPAPITVPQAPKGYINTLDVAGRKFYLDNRGDWYEYHGQMWPKDITVAQKVTDADKLTPYIQAGKVKQEPYWTKKKK